MLHVFCCELQPREKIEKMAIHLSIQFDLHFTRKLLQYFVHALMQQAERVDVTTIGAVLS